jgi:predicted amidohydrolase
MKVAVIQTKPVFGEISRNIENSLEMMQSTAADLYVLPELFTSGYLFESREELLDMAEEINGPTCSMLREFSESQNCTVYGGFPELEITSGGDNRVFNSAAMYHKGELLGVYRKLHLFAEETRQFDISENRPMVFDNGIAKLGPMICFDWVFPEMARSLALLGSQVLVHSSNLVLPFCQKAMVTRSIENGVFTLLANRIGTESRAGKELKFTGGSEIISPKGEVLAEAPTDEEFVLFAEFDPADAKNKWLTKRNHIFTDRRIDKYFMSAADAQGE